MTYSDRQTSRSGIVLVHKLPLQPVMLGLILGVGLAIKAKIFDLGLDLEAYVLCLHLGLAMPCLDLDLAQRGLVNIIAFNRLCN